MFEVLTVLRRKCFVTSFKYNIYLYTCTYSSVKSDSAIAAEMEQFNPRHSPHPTEHGRPCFLHTQRLVSQFCLQLHLMIFSSFSGACGRSIRIRKGFPRLISHSHQWDQYQLFPTSTFDTDNTHVDYGILLNQM